MTEPTLGRWPVALHVPVAWGDMDAFGHVNNSVFLRWFESARIAYLEEIGMLERMERERVGPIVARMACDYRRALEYPDEVEVTATVSRLGRSSFAMGYRAHSRRLGVLAAEGEGVIVLFDYAAGRAVPLGPELRTAIEALEQRGPV
jgi:acyl-CoA thioester hydrolase